MKRFDLLTSIHKGNTRKSDGSNIVGKLVGYRYYGFVRANVPDVYLPNYLKRMKVGVRGAKWVVMQIMGVGRVSEIRNNRENTSFAYGSILVLVNDNVLENDWYQVDGVSRTVLYDGTGDCCYISEMSKIDGSWCVMPVKTLDIELGEVSKVIEEYIVHSAESGVFVQPDKPVKYGTVKGYTGESNMYGFEEGKTLVDIGVEQPKPVKMKVPENQMNLFDTTEETKQVVEEPVKAQEVVETKPSTPTKLDENKPSNNIEWRKVKNRVRPKYRPVTRYDLAVETDEYKVLNNLIDLAKGVRKTTLEGLIEGRSEERRVGKEC